MSLLFSFKCDRLSRFIRHAEEEVSIEDDGTGRYMTWESIPDTDPWEVDQ